MKWLIPTYAVLISGVVAYEVIPEWLGKTCLLGTCVFTMAVPLIATLKGFDAAANNKADS